MNNKRINNIFNLFICSIIILFSFGFSNPLLNSSNNLQTSLKNAGVELSTTTTDKADKTASFEEDNNSDKKILNSNNTLPILFKNVLIFCFLGLVIIKGLFQVIQINKKTRYLYTIWANAPPVTF